MMTLGELGIARVDTSVATSGTWFAYVLLFLFYYYVVCLVVNVSECP